MKDYQCKKCGKNFISEDDLAEPICPECESGLSREKKRRELIERLKSYLFPAALITVLAVYVIYVNIIVPRQNAADGSVTTAVAADSTDRPDNIPDSIIITRSTGEDSVTVADAGRCEEIYTLLHDLLGTEVEKPEAPTLDFKLTLKKGDATSEYYCIYDLDLFTVGFDDPPFRSCENMAPLYEYLTSLFENNDTK